MDIASKSSPVFNFNVVPSLMDLRAFVAVTSFKTGYSWGDLCGIMHKFYIQNVSKKKDTLGFNFNNFKSLSRSDINAEILDKLKTKANPISSEFERNKFLDSVIPDKPESFISIRRKKYIESCGSLILDYDNDSEAPKYPMSVLSILDELSLNYISYSSYSSKTYHPKYRIIIPYSIPCSTETSGQAFELLLYIINRDYSDVTDHKLDVTCDQPWRFFYVPNNSPEKKITTDNTVWCNSAWFIAKENASFMDPKKIYQNLLKLRIAKAGVLTKDQIKNLLKANS